MTLSLAMFFFFSSRRRHTRFDCDWSSDVCSSDLACIDTKILDPSFAGRELDESFFRDLPPQVDPCGENGEFHTFVFDGPIFQSPIPIRTGEVVNRDGFVFCDLLPQPCSSPLQG